MQETYARVLARPRLLRGEDDVGYLLRALRNTFLKQKLEPRAADSVPVRCPDENGRRPARGRGPEEALEAAELWDAVIAKKSGDAVSPSMSLEGPPGKPPASCGSLRER